MNNSVNIHDILGSFKVRREAAEAILARYTPEQVEAARRVARLYDRCDPTSLKCLESTAEILVGVRT